MTHYKMIDETTLSNFRRFMASGIPLTEFGPAGAFDSKPKARDADPESVARGLAAMLLELKSQLGTEDFKALCARVCDEGEPEAEAEDDDPSAEFASPMEREMADKPKGDKRRAKDTKRKAMDDPAPFEGCPKTHAEDSAADPRFAFVVDMQRVKPSRPGAAYGDVSSKSARNASTSASFEKLYPDAAKVQVR